MTTCYFYKNLQNGFRPTPSASWCGCFLEKDGKCLCKANGRYFYKGIGFRMCPSFKLIDGEQLNFF